MTLRQLRAGLAAVGALLAAGLWWPADRAASAAPVDVCRLVPPDAAMWAVGAASPGEMVTTSVTPGSCSWRGISPACSMRALSVAVSVDDRAEARFHALKAATASWIGAPGVGDEAFFTADALPPGSGVLIEHLHVRRAHMLVELTVLGRLAPESTHQILGDLARTVDERVSGQSSSPM